MNWILLLMLTLILGISARPADENSQVTSTLKSIAETTNLTERPPIVTESAIEIITKKVTKTTEKVPVSDSISTSQVPTTTTRYLASQSLQTKPTTNAKKKYANNYANLITKHTLNSQRINNKISNVTVVNNSNNNNNNNNGINLSYVISSSDSSSINNNAFMKNVTPNNEHISIPIATISSPTTSNSSSKPLVFVDADVTFPHFTDLSTTKRAFIQLNGNSQVGGWSNYNLEDTNESTLTTRRKPVIHKIISKWSDNPSDVFNYHGVDPIIPSQQAQLNELKNQIVQSAYKQQQKYQQQQLPEPHVPHIPSVTSFDNLPTIVGQQLLHQQQHMSTITPTIPYRPTISNLLLLNRPNDPQSLKDYCNQIRIKLGTKYSPTIDSMEQCKGLNIFIDNKIDNSNLQASTADYEIPNNDKYEDPPSEDIYDNLSHQIETEPDSEDLPDSPTALSTGTTKVGNGGNKNKNKNKKKKQGSGSQIEEEPTDMGSMVMTVMTMMAVFNPLNFGVWGIILAPVAAMTLGGVCFVMYQLMTHQKSEKQVWHHPQPWPKPQEIIIRNKINHSAIPIKITHLHKHAGAPQKILYTHPPAQQQPQIIHHDPVMEYSPPWHSAPAKQPSKSYGEPPADSYFPSAPDGGPYRRKTSMSKHKNRRPNPFKYKLL